MLLANVKAKVKKVIEEDREMLDKDGVTKRQRHIVNIALVDGEGDLIKLTSFDPKFKLPKVGEEWAIPAIKRLECFDGIVQSIMV